MCIRDRGYFNKWKKKAVVDDNEEGVDDQLTLEQVPTGTALPDVVNEVMATELPALVVLKGTNKLGDVVDVPAFASFKVETVLKAGEDGNIPDAPKIAPPPSHLAARAAAERAHLESNMPLLRILHDHARGAIIGLLSCMRSRLRKEVAASNLAAFLHPSRADVTMDFNQPRAWVDPHTEEWSRRYRQLSLIHI